MQRILAVALAVVVLAVALVVVRVWLEARAEWRAGEGLVAEYNALPRGVAADEPAAREQRAVLLHDAVVRFREAALWLLPGSPYARRAVERLLLIGQRAEQSADDALALYAFRAARSAILGTRGFLIADEDGLQRADAGIARVSARLERMGSGGEDAPSPAERERKYLAQLAPPDDPDPWFAVLAAAGLLAWVGGAMGFALRGLDEHCRLRFGVTWRAAAVVACGLGAWAAGLALA